MKRKRNQAQLAYPAKYEAAVKRRSFNATIRGVPVRKFPQRRLGFVARTPGGQITADNHYFDTERTATAIASNTASWTASEYDPNTSAMLCLFAPVIGDDIANRIGRKIFVKSIRLKGIITCAPQTAQSTTPDVPVVIRMIVYQDKQTNGAQSQGEDVISSGAASNALNMFTNSTNFGRFNIVKDKFITLQNPTMAGITATYEQSGLNRQFKMNCKVNQWVSYNATNGGTVADVVDNSWHFIANCNSAALVPFVAYKVRTVFAP